MSTGTNQERIEQNNALLIENSENLINLKAIVESLPVNMETSEATATAEDIFRGKTAFVNGELITGTMTDLSSTQIQARNKVTYTNWESDSKISVLATLGNNGYVKADGTKVQVMMKYSELAEFIGLTADKIKAGETILGITGTYEGEASIEQVTEQAEVLETQTASLEELEEIIDSKL